MTALHQFTRGLFKENPIFKLVLGMCPALAVTTSLENSLGMGVAATFVLLCSNVVISALRNVIPEKTRIPCFIVVIASFVTIVDLTMNAYAPDLHASLGIFVPLIVVNCIILGRAEAYASKHPLGMAFIDGLGMGLGFTLGLAALGAAREILGAGTLTLWKGIQWHIAAPDFSMIMFILPPGGFVALGVLMAVFTHIRNRRAVRSGKELPVPPMLDCRHCTICKWGK
jgi:electron transport complex protein RnfE